MTEIPGRWRRIGGAHVALYLGEAGMGHPEELDMVGCVRPSVKRHHDFIDGEDFLYGMQVEHRDALQGHLGDNAQGTKTHLSYVA